MNFENIICYIREKHAGQKRIGGEDYVNHPIVVADIIKSKNGTEECIATAYFHDIALPVKLADRIHNLRCAPLANEAFKRKYIIETEAYYVDLSMGTFFERELMEALVLLKESLC